MFEFSNSKRQATAGSALGGVPVLRGSLTSREEGTGPIGRGVRILAIASGVLLSGALLSPICYGSDRESGEPESRESDAKQEAPVVTSPARVIDPEHDAYVASIEKAPIENAQLPLDAEFFDHRGQKISLGSLFESDRPTVLALVYFTCPMVCGKVTESLQKAMAVIDLDVGDDYQVVFVSIDPRDKPTVSSGRRDLILEYYEQAGQKNRESAENGLQVLVAESDSPVRKLAESIGYGYSWDEESQEFGHTSAIYFVTPDGRLSNYIGGWEYDSHDFKFSLMDAANGKIGTVWDKISFFCMYRDPVSGKYQQDARLVMRIGGALVLGALLMVVLIARRSTAKRRNLKSPETGSIVGVES